MRSFDAIEDPTMRSVLQLLCFKATYRAKYFCAGMLDIAKYSHYALNTPLYTHFTSPIRRYADIIVHRQLEFILQGSSAGSCFIQLFRGLLTLLLGDNSTKFNMDRDAVAKVTQQCNMYVSLLAQLWHPHADSVNSKRDSAILAREQSTHLFLCVLISDLTSRYGPVIRQAKVIGVLDAAFDVLIPEFGIEKRVHVDQMPIDV
jgi:protein SSD1